MQPQRAGTFISVRDYLDSERDSQVRHEYMDGEVYTMGRGERPACPDRGKPVPCFQLVTFRSVGIEVGMDQSYRRTDR